jgi:hypothetical protein
MEKTMALLFQNPATVADANWRFYEKFYEGSVVNQKMSQSFPVTSAILLSKVSLYIGTNAYLSPSGTLRVSIYAADVNHNPTGSVLGYSEISASITGGAWRDFDFSTPLSLSTGLHALVITAEDIPLPPSPNSYKYDVGLTYLTDQYADGKHRKWTGVWVEDSAAADLMFQIYGTEPLPTNITGVVTIPNTGGTITFTEDMTVQATGELTLDVAQIGDLVGTSTIHVAAGGKLKLTGGQQITVLPDTSYALTLES